MCWLKILHFTLRRTHLHNHASHIHSAHTHTIGTMKPLNVWQRACCFFPPFPTQHQGLVPNFVVISKIKDKQKHPAPNLLPLRKKEQGRRVTEREMKRRTRGDCEEGGGYWIQASTRPSERSWERMKRDWVLVRPQLSVCVYSAS